MRESEREKEREGERINVVALTTLVVVIKIYKCGCKKL